MEETYEDIIKRYLEDYITEPGYRTEKGYGEVVYFRVIREMPSWDVVVEIRWEHGESRNHRWTLVDRGDGVVKYALKSYGK